MKTNPTSPEAILTDRQKDILNKWFNISTSGNVFEWCYPYPCLVEFTGYRKEILQKEFKVLRKLKYIEYHRGLIDEDGRVCGSGYSLSYSKSKEIKGLTQTPSPEETWEVRFDIFWNELGLGDSLKPFFHTFVRLELFGLENKIAKAKREVAEKLEPAISDFEKAGKTLSNSLHFKESGREILENCEYMRKYLTLYDF